MIVYRYLYLPFEVERSYRLGTNGPHPPRRARMLAGFANWAPSVLASAFGSSLGVVGSPRACHCHCHVDLVAASASWAPPPVWPATEAGVAHVLGPFGIFTVGLAFGVVLGCSACIALLLSLRLATAPTAPRAPAVRPPAVGPPAPSAPPAADIASSGGSTPPRLLALTPSAKRAAAPSE
jgi:hypothetical protein